MKRLILILLILTAAIISVAFRRFPQQDLFGQRGEMLLQTTPIPQPTEHIIPGAAPDFQAQSRKGFDLVRSLQESAFWVTFFKWARRLQLNQGGAIWLAAIITLLVAFDFSKIRSRRNLDLLLLLLPSLFLMDLVTLGNTPEDASQMNLFGFLFLGLFLVTLILFIRALVRGLGRPDNAWRSNLPRVVLVGLTIFLFLMNSFLALARAPDDAGAYTNIGAYQMLKTGNYPYGNPELRGGAAATYGPLLYLAHMPFQLVLQPLTNLAMNDANSVLHRVVMGHSDPNYVGPPALATKLAMVTFLFLATIGLYRIGKSHGNVDMGWGMACLFLGSAYVQGLGGDQWYITGVTYISHIAPAAITIWAFLYLKKPAISGAVLAIGAGTLFYPAFLFPLWFGYYFWKRGDWKKFTISFVLVIAVILASVLLMTQHGENETVFHVIYESTIGHQEAQDAYGSSTFSFWSTQPGITALWQKQLIPGVYLLRISVLFFAVFLGLSFFMARRRNMSQMAFLTAAVVIAVQLWKSHAGGTYVEWYYPFFLIGLLYPYKEDPKELDVALHSSETAPAPEAGEGLESPG